MKQIPLTKGRVALVDDADFCWLSKHKWGVVTIRSHSYPARAERPNGISGPARRIYMHRVIMGNPPCKVDHRNRNTFDNRRRNLRKATDLQNTVNSRGQNKSSQFKGVSRHGKQWIARIKTDGINYMLGVFDSEIDAAKRYNKVARELWGDFAYQNPIAYARRKKVKE